MVDKLTKREQGFVKDIALGKSGRQAVADNFNMKGNSAGAYAGKLKKKPKVIKRLLSIADSIPDKLLVEKHLELLNKKEVVTKNNASTHEVDTIPTGEIDVQAVSKGLEMAYKLKGSYASDKVDITSNGETITGFDYIIPNESNNNSKQ